MSYFTLTKRKTTLKSILAVFGLTICAFALMASPAYADPEKKVEDATEMVDEKAEQVEDAAKDKMGAPVVPMELPQTDKPKIESTDDAPVTTEPPVTPVPETAIKVPTVKQPVDFSAPVPSVTEPVLDKSQSCYKQEGGSYECICEGDKDCAELSGSDICEPATSWRNDDGFGGCTKKAE